MSGVRIMLSNCLALFCVLWLLAAGTFGVNYGGHDDCESSGENVTCGCDCHGFVAPHHDTCILPDTEFARPTSREPYIFIYMIESDIFRPPIV